MKAWLLDANLLIALADALHVHHEPAVVWFERTRAPFATCPITQGALIRTLLRHRAVADVSQALTVLAGFTAHPRHRFWADDVAYADINWAGVVGYRQVTDSYVAALARHHRGRVATLDRGLAALHEDVAELVPT